MPERVMCQCCERMLVPRADGTSRYHNWRRGSEDYCPGSRHRLARWPVGQRLRHHAGSIWEVTEDLGGRYGDYMLLCVLGTKGFSGQRLEEAGQTMVTHGEYMHRDGWRPLTAPLQQIQSSKGETR